MPKWSKYGVAIGIWILLGLFFATKNYFDSQMIGRHLHWTKALWWQFMEWLTWGALSPIPFWICRKFFRQPPSWTHYLVIHLGVGSVLAITQASICTVGAIIEGWALDWPETPYGDPFSIPFVYQFTVVNHFHYNLLIYTGIVSVWHALDYSRRLREREKRAAELETRLAQAQLQALKMQLQPHFLFNTLNGIAALNYSDPKAANLMIARLSDLLRMALEHGEAQEIALKQELEFNQCYLDLERIRLGDRLNVRLNIPPETLDALVPAWLLQPLIENAIKHGIAPFSKRGELLIRAERNNCDLLLDISDNGPGLPPTPRTNGVGLKNISRRLAELYGERFRFEVANATAGGVAAQIVLPFREAATTTPGFSLAG
jgi:two-component system LytT family sensor kinase